MWKWLTNNRLGMLLLTRRRGELVGEDEFGNQYYRQPGGRPAGGGGGPGFRNERRWVVYAGDGEIEASTVPPGWNGWLKHNLERPPSESPLPSQPWEKEHLPNLSGTAGAYLPPGHENRGGQRDAAVGDYEAWRP